MIWKKKRKKKRRRRKRKQKFRAFVEEAQVVAAFETFFLSPALKLLVYVSEIFQELLSNIWEFEMTKKSGEVSRDWVKMDFLEAS